MYLKISVSLQTVIYQTTESTWYEHESGNLSPKLHRRRTAPGERACKNATEKNLNVAVKHFWSSAFPVRGEHTHTHTCAGSPVQWEKPQRKSEAPGTLRSS